MSSSAPAPAPAISITVNHPPRKKRFAANARIVLWFGGCGALFLLYLASLHRLSTNCEYTNSYTNSNFYSYHPSRPNDNTTATRNGVLPLPPPQTTKHGNDDDRQAVCDSEYHRITANFSRLSGLTALDFERSLAYPGNRRRVSQLVAKLQGRRTSVTGLVCGGSITLGHGVEPKEARYSDQLGVWLNDAYPLRSDEALAEEEQKQRHVVYNRGSHGADMCALAKRMNFFRMPSPPDFFVLEFAVNDYQGQDHVLQVDHREDVFFEGFERIAACAESVVHRLLTDYPDAAVLFLEFQTAVLSRRTAQFLHMGVAQHYKIPVVSYADMMAPDFYRLLETLQPYNFALPTNKSFDIDSILPYPHGCAPCKPLDMTEQFRPDGCVSLCSFALEAGMTTSCPWEKTIFSSYKPCYVPFFAHDDVHPSATGHRMARDLVAHLIAHTALLMCRDRNQTYTDHGVPSHTGWLVSGSNYQQVLRARSDFVLVKDTMSIFAEPNPLMASFHTPGFELKLDNLFRRGWIAENATGGERVTFDIDLPIGECYVITLSVLNSYATMGSFNVTVEDTTKNTTTASQTVDCLWKPRISVPADVQVTSDERAECTGRCKVTITTNPEIADGRKGNLVKILTLAVRKCFLPPTV